ncbi:MAG: esterase/lipase family protein [Opitutaceae bacterium]
MKVILVHGWLNNPFIMRGLANDLTRKGHACVVPSLRPSDGRGGLAMLSRKLQDVIDAAFPSESERFALIGFSMGVIVCRYYLQELGGHARARAFFSICGPHAGTRLAHFFPTQGIREMRPESAFLAQLERSSTRLGSLPIVCYWTPFDMMIRPLASARWKMGEAVRVLSPLHAFMPFHKFVRADIARRLAALE